MWKPNSRNSIERPSFLGATAVAGVGFTDFSKASPHSVLRLAVDSCRAAIEDAGLAREDIDGVISYSLFNDSVACQAVATELALPDLTYALDMNMGGVSPALAVMNAAMAVSVGVARNVLVFRALKGRSGVRVGAAQFRAPTGQYRYPIGYGAYPYYMAMLARRFMIDTGATEEDLGAVAIAQRVHAARNERALRRAPLTLDEYLEAPWVAEPFHTVDCTTEIDGACAVLVTSLETARALLQPPAVIDGAAWATGFGSGLDIADLHSWPDYATICHHALADRLWRSAGIGPGQVDVAELYDCFTAPVLFTLEGLGLVGPGESGSFVRDGHTALDGRLPVNTHGGLLCEGYLHGMNTLAEGVIQVQGRGGERQVDRAETCLVTSGAMGDGSAMIFRRG
jgi:acetyl-CoA acetyltransferase